MTPLRAARCLRPVGVLVLTLGLAVAAPAAAGAHAFLVASNPQAGARLVATPRALTLSFSERFVPGSDRVAVRGTDGEVVKLPTPIGRGTLVRQPLPRGLRGVFVVSWRVLADDGHVSAGELAFAIGRGGTLPAVTAATSSRTPPEQVAFSVLLFLGLALAVGGLASEGLVWRRPADAVRVAPIVAGAAIGLPAAAGQLILLVGERAGGGFGTGLDLDRLGDATGTRPGLLTLVILGSLLAAAALAAARRARWLAAIPLLIAIVSVSLRGHAGSSGHAWAVAADAIHLAGAALWLGALLQVVFAVRASAPGTRRDATVVGIRRYAALALPIVLVILVTGPLSALAELHSPRDLVSTGYGRTLLIKGGLVSLALTLALCSRVLALPPNPGVRIRLLRRLTRVEVIALLGVLVAVALLVNAAPPRGSARASTPRTPALGPPALAGPTVQVADLAGLATVVAVQAGPEELRFTVLRADDPAPPGTRLKVEAEGSGRAADLYPRPCGPGCFEIRHRLKPGLTRLTASVHIPRWPAGAARLAVRWPPGPEEPKLLARVRGAMRSVPALVLREHVTSGPAASGGTATSREAGKSFIGEEPYGATAVDIRPIDSRRPHRTYAFALPGSSIWVRVTVDGRFRLVRETIVSPGHLIERTFAYPRG